MSVAEKESLKRSRRDDEEEESVTDENGSESSSEGSEEEEEEDDEYESIQMTQKQYDNYINELNGRYAKLNDDLQLERTKVARDGNIVSVTDNLERANQLYDNSKRIGDSHYQNEISHIDSKAIRQIGEQASLGINSINLGGSDRGLKFEEFATEFTRYAKTGFGATGAMEEEEMYEGEPNDVDALRNHFSSLNWNKVSGLYLKTSAKVVSIDFMLGPLEIEFKKRTFTRREDDSLKTGQVVKPSAVQLDELTKNNEKDTYQSAIHCFDILRKKNHQRPINLFKFFINPHSFSQSVENLFYLSFLINHNKLMLYKDEEGVPQLALPETVPKMPEYINERFRKTGGKAHLIFKLEYDTWLKLIDIYKIEEPFLGNRANGAAA